MTTKYNSKRIFLFFILTLSVFTMSQFTNNSGTSQNLRGTDLNDIPPRNYGESLNIKSQGIVQDIYTEEWLDNPNFTSTVDPWYNETSGDDSDVNATFGSDAANLEILGDERTFSISGTPQNADYSEYANPDLLIYPDTHVINNSEGCRVENDYDESVGGGNEDTGVRWQRNFTMPVNMSDYIITSASVTAIFNASVELSPGNDGVDVTGDSCDAVNAGDFAKFFVMLSDHDRNQEFVIASNKTQNLGQDAGPAIPTYQDTLMNSVSEDVIIALLTYFFTYNPYNFSIILGIDIRCEDNMFSYDRDLWHYLIIREVNLTFTYAKKIDQGTSASWNQIGDKLPAGDVDVINATLNFKYKINNNFSVDISPNSELRIYLNDIQTPETVVLSQMNMTYEVKNIDVGYLIKENSNITLSIELYMADECIPDQIYNITIDDVSLEISYGINAVEDDTTYDLFLNSENKTQELHTQVKLGELVNLSVNYKNSTGDFIPNATAVLSGWESPKNLTQNDPVELYNITINTTYFDLGNNYLTLDLSKRYYKSFVITLRIEIFDRESKLDVFLNGVNKTGNLELDIPIGSDLNITVNYRDNITDEFIDIATVKLVGDYSGTFLVMPAEDNYTILVDTDDLGLGVKFITIYAQRTNYSAINSLLRVNVELKAGEISTKSGESVASIDPGGDYTLKIKLEDILTGGDVAGATVRFYWEFGQGTLTDSDGDGVYEAILEAIPEGSYTITITATTNGDYQFDSIQLTINALSTTGGINIIFVIILIGAVAAVSAVAFVIVKKSKKEVREKESEIELLKRQRGEITEDDITLSKEAHFCLVHKGPIDSYIFICPDCGAYYCDKCVEAIKDIENACWSCGKVLDSSKPVIDKKILEDIEVSETEFASKEHKHKKPKKSPEKASTRLLEDTQTLKIVAPSKVIQPEIPDKKEPLEAISTPDFELQTKIQKLEERITSIKNTIENLDESFKTGDLAELDYNIMRNPLIKKCDSLNAELEAYKK